jgi:nicotinate-nucleotide pyrophosphorylase (carboxylating)
MSKLNQNHLLRSAIREQLKTYFQEDDLSRNSYYLQSLPSDLVNCSLKIKDDLVLSGLPYFFEAMNFFMNNELDYTSLLESEGKWFNKSDKKEINFSVPFSVVLTAERIALNLLQQSSSISTHTKRFVDKVKDTNISILDTRKTTPGLRALEKYAVRKGGGFNHRLGQADIWMIKDNHKKFFGGVEAAIDFFKSQGTFYNPVVLEIHSLEELNQAIELNISHVMLDNFTPELIKEAIKIKPSSMTYEVSGGLNLENLDGYLIEGVDAFSIGAITYNAPHVDISLKFEKQ